MRHVPAELGGSGREPGPGVDRRSAAWAGGAGGALKPALGTAPPLRVLMLCPELQRYLGRRNSDVRTYALLRRLEQSHPLEMKFCHSLPFWLVANGSYGLASLLHRIRPIRRLLPEPWWSRLRRGAWLPNSELRRAAPDVLYTVMLVPLNLVPTPMVLEVDFNAWGIPEVRAEVDRARFLPRQLLERAAVIVVRHEASLRALGELHPDLVDRAIVIPSFLPDCEAVDEESVRAKFAAAARGVVRVLFVGNLARAKGLPELVAAWERVRCSTSVELTVVSRFDDGPVALPREVRRHSALPSQDVHRLMAESHIFAMPTKRDSHGRVFWEAMAHGCALLAPCFPPHPELFEGYGLTADPRSAEDVARALAALASDPTFSLTRALRGRRDFLARHHHSVAAAQYYEAFCRAARRTSSANRQTR